MKEAGIYLHIPFCKSRCSYCDFATDVFKNTATVERYVAAVVQEITNFEIPEFQIVDSSQSKIQNPKSKIQNRADTIYFGGGTPSLLTPPQLEAILTAIQCKFSVAPDAEITMEMNPGTLSPEILRDFRQAGINRASFGAQTFDDTELKRLGRKHTAADVRQTIEFLRQAGFENVSFDLIAGLPRQTLADWKRNLNEALKLEPEHLSLYLLEIHEGTPLAEQIRSGRQPAPDEDAAAVMYEILQETTEKAGYQQYEISNFCRPNFQSRHNSKYWTLDPVFGFGCAAHSFDGVKNRYANERDTAGYVSQIEKNGQAVAFKEEIEATAEFIFLGLRLRQGIDLTEFTQRFQFQLGKKFAPEIENLQAAGLLEFAENHLRLTKKGMLFSNEVFTAFV